MMKRLNQLVLCTTLLLMVLPESGADAQVMLSPAFESDQSQTADGSAEAGETIVRSITLHASPTPDPALRYRLWPAPEKRRRRNCMVVVNRAIILSNQLSSKQRRDFEAWHHELHGKPLAEFPIEDAKQRLEPLFGVLNELQRCENWMDYRYGIGIEEMSTSEKIATVLPEYQEMRGLARMLSTRARVAASEERWGDALADLRLGFRLAEIAGHSTDLLISRLIGLAIAEHMMETIETMIEHPKCPNLYWALAAIPVDRLFDMRAAIEFESSLLPHVGALTGRPELGRQVIGEQAALLRIKEIADGIEEMFRSYENYSRDIPLLELSTGLYVAMMVEPSRDLLAESPLWRDRVSELSDAEIVLRASDLELRRIRDRWLTWSLLPPEFWEEYRAERRAAFSPSRSLSAGANLANILLPAVEQAVTVGYRSKQRHHRLITLEAIRLHAAESGSLPENIDKLRPVPAWLDPMVREPFGYARKSPTTAVLRRAPRFADDQDLLLEIKLEKIDESF